MRITDVVRPCVQALAALLLLVARPPVPGEAADVGAGAALRGALAAPIDTCRESHLDGQRLARFYRDDAGRHYDPGALDRLNHLLRCHYTEEVAAIDLPVIEFLRAVDQGLGGDREIHIISGFRSAAYNAWLIRHGSGVAGHSLHLVGRVIDVRFPGLSLGQARRVALDLGWGGVGYYPASGFIHRDSGRVRSW